MEKGAISRVYAERNFRLFTVGSVVSWLAFFVQMLAVSWLTWELTHSSAWLGIIAFLDTAPFFLFGPIGSVLTDRMDRDKLLLAAESCALVRALALALASASGLLDIHLLAALTFIHGMIHAFGVPAQFGLLPRAVSKANLCPAIAINSAYRTLAMFAGPALAGIVLAWFPVYTAFLINAFGYVVYLAVLMMMGLPPAARAEPSGKGYYGDYIDGLRYTIAHPAIALLFLLTFFNDGLRGITGRLLPAFADKVFGLGSTGLAILAGATGIGAAIASIWLAQRQRPKRTSLIALWSFGGAIATTLLLSQRIISGSRSRLPCLHIYGFALNK
jgi:MFS family permease